MQIATKSLNAHRSIYKISNSSKTMVDSPYLLLVFLHVRPTLLTHEECLSTYVLT